MTHLIWIWISGRDEAKQKTAMGEVGECIPCIHITYPFSFLLFFPFFFSNYLNGTCGFWRLAVCVLFFLGAGGGEVLFA